MVRQSLLELIRRQKAGKPLDDAAPTPLIERKPGHWSGLPLFESRSSSPSSNKRSASVVTQKTTLPQIETIKQRDQASQVEKKMFQKKTDDCSFRFLEI